MIPISLVTGFLGSGKTTFLRRIIARFHDRRIVYLVNEFSPMDVDGHVLEAETNELVALPGGSIFCRCLVTEFIGALNAVSARVAAGEAPVGAGEAPVGGVVIEASGVANPSAVLDMFRETGLDRDYALSSIVSIVDPITLPALVQSLPNIARQIESSDVVIVNKVDLCSPGQIDQAEDEVRRIKPDAVVVRATHCDVDVEAPGGVPLLGPGLERALEGELALCRDPNYARMSVQLDGDLDLGRLRDAINPLGADLYRLKGFARVNGALMYIDYSTAGLKAEPAGTPDAPPVLVFIVRGAAAEQGHELAARLKDGVACTERRL
ncbi:MAG: GTP-binding protein [Candidatus Hydrogenedentes bacterium]|nr:GTP-binding protein [Candidatus Hydrogenedentota bacterium]